MKKALIAKNELRENGYRAAQVEDTELFYVTDPLFWVDCPDDLVADAKWYDPVDGSFKDFPPPPPPPKPINQPTTTGTQTL